MTAEGYDYACHITKRCMEPGGSGTYNSTYTILCIEVTVDPPPWTCPSCRTTKSPLTGPQPLTERRWPRRRTDRTPRRS